MFDTSWIADLDGDAACEAIQGTQSDLREAEWRELVLAAHWATLHPAESLAAQPGRRGGERAVRRGGDGTPEVAEFACAELALLMGTGYISASMLLRDALDLQHRHPLLWTALSEGRGRVWKARKVAAMAHAAGLTREQAWQVDAATTEYVDTLSWSSFTRLVEAKIIEADPRAAEERRLAEEMRRFVVTGQANDHGLKTLVARATAGEVIYLVAMCDRIAQILELQGDTASVDVRRSKALGILANPARALALLEQYADGSPHPDDPDPDPDPQAEPPGESTSTLCSSCGGPRVDPEKLRPRAVLHVRISEQALRRRAGSAYVENDSTVVPAGALRGLLGHHHVTVRPVLDLRGQTPVDAYEVPSDMREALRMARLSSVFPWSRAGTPRPDLDHTVPYVAPADGGRPGQTRPGNLGPMTRFGHRVKTHARGWRHRQSGPGTYLWRTPHGYWFRVDNDGTHPLGRDPDQAELVPPPPGRVDVGFPPFTITWTGGLAS